MTATRERWLLVLVAMMSILIVTCIAIPAWRSGYQAALEAADLEVRVERLERRQAEVRRIRDEYEAMQAEVRTSFKRVPTTAETAQVVQALSLQVDGIRVMDQGFTAGIGGTPSEGDFAILPIAVTLEGDFDAIFSVIHKAEALDRLLRVSSVRITRPDDDGSTTAPVLEAAIGLHAVFDPLQEGN